MKEWVGDGIPNKPGLKMSHSSCALVRHFQPRVHHISMSTRYRASSCMKCLTYEKRLSAPCLESLELRRSKANVIVCFKILRGFTNVIPSKFFVWSSCSTRGHGMKLYYSDSRVTVRQNFLSVCLSNYGINCQKKWHQPAVSVLLYRVYIQCICRF